MTKGENIYKRKDGRWEGRYKKGYGEDQKIIYGYCYGRSYREVKEKVNLAKIQWLLHYPDPQAGAYPKNFGAYGLQWLKINENRLKPSTLIKYYSMLQNHIMPQLGMYDLTELSSYSIAVFSEVLLDQKHLAPKTVRDILIFVHKILVYMQEETGNQMHSITISYPKLGKKELRVLSPEEQRRLTAYLLQELDIYKFSILLALFTGLRIGEICALQWKDISPDTGILTVTHTVQRLKTALYMSGQKTSLQIGTPKTVSSVRTIPLTNGLAEICNLFRPDNPEAFVMTGTEEFLDPRYLQRKLKRYTTELDMPDVHFHTLRHTFATRCIEFGCDTKTLSELLGHSNISTTMNRYVHPSLEFKRENIVKLEAAGFFSAVNAAVSCHSNP